MKKIVEGGIYRDLEEKVFSGELFRVIVDSNEVVIRSIDDTKIRTTIKKYNFLNDKYKGKQKSGLRFEYIGR